ncbi:MAG: cyclase family protein [Clostridia bacterium]|nr:cyclase family protein [Clostridia bacterium]
MKKIIDITGTMQDGMWGYEAPFPSFSIRPLPPVPWVKGPVYCELFEGMHSQTGTYLETPAHFYGTEKSYPLIEVPVEKLIDLPCVVLNLGNWNMDAARGRRGITVEDLERCPNAGDIRPGDAILLGTGWGRYWMDANYLNLSPFITRDAMRWLISKKPFMLGGDSARWENLEKPEGIFHDFYAADILMIGPAVGLEACGAARSRLTVLPLKIPRTSCTPCRAVVIEE